MRYSIFITFISIIIFASCRPDRDPVQPSVGCDCDPDDINYIAPNTTDTIFFSTAFSPNNDADNDFWEFNVNTENAYNLMVNLAYKIYDNRGNLLFENTGEGVCKDPWDGRNIKSGCYRYEIYYENKLIIDNQYLKVIGMDLSQNDPSRFPKNEGCGCKFHKLNSLNDVALQCED